MKKNIIVSSVAAAALAAVLTGCGSDDATTSGTTVSGTTSKVTLQGATVAVGDKIITSDSTGHYSVVATINDGDTISVTGGKYDYNGNLVDNPFTQPLKVIYDSSKTSNNATPQSTLFAEFKSDSANATLSDDEIKNMVANYLGMSSIANFDEPLDDGSEQEGYAVALFQILSAAKDGGALSTAITLIKAATSTTLGTAVDRTALLNTLATNLPTVITTTLKATIANVLANPTAQGAALMAYAGDETTTITEVAYQNTINLEGNETANDSTAALFYADGNDLNDTTSISWTGLKYTDVNNTDDMMTTTTNFNANKSLVGFKFYDVNGTLAGTAENGELIMSFTKQEDNGTNANASYQLALQKLTVTIGSDKNITLTSNSNTSLVIGANSNTSKALGLDGNVTALLGDSNATIYSSVDGNGALGINIAKFANYVKDTFGTDYDTPTLGNFSVAMTDAHGIASGNYSLKLLVKFGDNKVTKNDAKNYINIQDISVGGTTYSGYKVIDTKLVNQ